MITIIVIYLILKKIDEFSYSNKKCTTWSRRDLNEICDKKGNILYKLSWEREIWGKEK